MRKIFLLALLCTAACFAKEQIRSQGVSPVPTAIYKIPPQLLDIDGHDFNSITLRGEKINSWADVDPSDHGGSGVYATKEWVENYTFGYYVAKTNGQWVIVQSPGWTGLEWGGERVFGAVMEVHDTSMARITGLQMHGTNELVLSFHGAETNHLEACCDQELRDTWGTWDDCGWEYPETFDGSGQVIVSNASPDCWYRVVADGPVPPWSNIFVASYSPLYIFDGTNRHRVATLEDADSIAGLKISKATRYTIPKKQYEDNINVSPTNVAWDFNNQEGPYIRHLTIGGQTYETQEVVEEGGETVTNTVTVTNLGSITLNGVTWKGFPDLGGQIFEEVVDDGQGGVVTNTWTNAGILELDGIAISNWNQLRGLVGNGFPLLDNADFAGYGASNVSYFAWSVSEEPHSESNILYYDGEKLMLGTNEVGSGSLESIWGPAVFTNQDICSTNLKAKSLGIMPAETSPNIRIMFDPTNSIYYLQAYSAIAGPRGADGVGNVLWAGTYSPGMVISNDNTWVSWNGSIWTRNASVEPVMEIPTNSQSSTWRLVVSRGQDGTVGAPGKDGIGLHFVDWSTNIAVFDTNDLISANGWLLMITNDVPTPNPGQPIANGLPTKHYKTIVRPGKDGIAADVYTNATFVIEFDPLAPVPAHSLVVYEDFLWYARQDYIPGETTLPVSGAYWICIGKRGEQGPAGLNGIGNLLYRGEWDIHKIYNVNDIVRYVSSDGKTDWYRALVEPLQGTRPDTGTNYWAREITSGRDGYNMQWHFVDGPYDAGISHSNELYRATDGKVWYSVGVVPAGDGYAPGRNAAKWKLLVKDGVAISGDEGSTIWRGIWDDGGSYDPGDLVTWQHGGGKSLYICTSATPATAEDQTATPSDTRYWLEIVSGIQGTNGKDGTLTNTVYNVTNITTIVGTITNMTYTTNIVNTNTTSILDYDLGAVRPEVKFIPQHFYWNDLYSTYYLTAEALGVSSFNGMLGSVGIAPGTGVTFSTNNQHIITINATEVDLGPYALNANLLSVSNAVNMTNAVFESRISSNSSVIATNRMNIATNAAGISNLWSFVSNINTSVTIITNNITTNSADIAEIASAISSLNPVITTPDGKKWTAQGVYAEPDIVTHVWVPWTGIYSAPIRVSMVDGRIFEMVGVYADGNTNAVTHKWELVSDTPTPEPEAQTSVFARSNSQTPKMFQSLHESFSETTSAVNDLDEQFRHTQELLDKMNDDLESLIIRMIQFDSRMRELEMKKMQEQLERAGQELSLASPHVVNWDPDSESVIEVPVKQIGIECHHNWIRDPEKSNFVYCSLPPKYDWVCTKCGATKVDFDPVERQFYKVDVPAELLYTPSTEQ